MYVSRSRPEQEVDDEKIRSAFGSPSTLPMFDSFTLASSQHVLTMIVHEMLLRNHDCYVYIRTCTTAATDFMASLVFAQ